MSASKNAFVFASKIVDLSEDKDFLTLKNRVFFFNSPNLNNVQLNYDSSSLEKCKSLINMPLVARYVKRNGKDDLGGHEVKVVDGEYEFQTAAIGTITDVEIVEEDVETVDGTVKRLPCLYATERVWTRFKNATRAVKSLFMDGNLNNSWELKSSSYTFEDGIKYISDYKFLANCLLGTGSYPAYGKGAAKVLEISEHSDEYEYLAAESFEEALSLDMEDPETASYINQLDDSSDREEEKLMETNETVIVENSEVNAEEEAVETVEAEVAEVEETAEANTEEEVSNETPEVSEGDPAEDESATEAATEEAESAPEANNGENEESEEETSAMRTEEDIRKMLWKAVDRLHDDDEWYYIGMVFPEEQIVLVQSGKMKRMQFKQYSYRIDGEEIVLENPKDVELTISPLEINSEIEAKNNAIAEANSRIVELEAQVSELNKYKEELETIKAERENAERAEAVEKLRKYVIDSGRFTEDEINSEEVSSAIENLNEAWIKSEIADRLVASLSKSKGSCDVEASSKDNNKDLSIVLSSVNEEKSVTSEDVMRAFFEN